jgi:hypothetical protein
MDQGRGIAGDETGVDLVAGCPGSSSAVRLWRMSGGGLAGAPVNGTDEIPVGDRAFSPAPAVIALLAGRSIFT